MSRQSLPKPADFARVRADGRSRVNAHLVLQWAARPDGGGRRLGLVVSNKHGKAVAVNRLKRVLREAFWQRAERLPDDCDYVLIARAPLRALDDEGGMPAVAASLEKLTRGNLDPARR